MELIGIVSLPASGLDFTPANVLPGLLGVLLLVMVGRRMLWAWHAYLTLQFVGFALIVVFFALTQILNAGVLVIAWSSVITSLVAVIAVFAPGVRPGERRPEPAPSA